MFNKKTMVLVRGCSGAGKSTLTRNIVKACEALGLSHVQCEADKYFVEDGIYTFDPAKLHKAHKWCQKQAENAIKLDTDLVIVSNTSTTEKELKPYIEMAEEAGYDIVSLIVENRHRNGSIHYVPQEVLLAQEERFSTKLI